MFVAHTRTRRPELSSGGNITGNAYLQGRSFGKALAGSFNQEEPSSGNEHGQGVQVSKVVLQFRRRQYIFPFETKSKFFTTQGPIA